MRRRNVLASVIAGTAILAATCGPSRAQSSASHRVSDLSFTGGAASAAAPSTSPSYRVTLAAVGDVPRGVPTLSGAAYSVSGGFVGTYPPPLEVANLRFAAPGSTRLAWNAEPSAGTYQVYRGAVGGPPAPCLAGPLTLREHVDPAAPAPGSGFQYLVTARNRLGEEGTAGNRSDGSARTTGAACP